MIEIKDLVIKYGDFTAVKGISLEIEEGEFFTFLGPSGCGKTTTLRSIAGFEKPAAGMILADGTDLWKLEPEQRNIGFVFQNYALFPSMNVYQNIAYGLKVRKFSKEQIDKKIHEVAEKVGISQYLQSKISELSGGQQQRIAVARALVVEPRILLMDEPLSNLDAKLRVSMRKEIKKLQQDLKITTIYVTHDQEEALSISDRIAVFNVGKIDQVGNAITVYENPRTEFVAKFIGEINQLTGLFGACISDHLGLDISYNLFIRPQNVYISDDKESSDRCSVNVKVLGFEFLGASSKIQGITDDGCMLECQVFGRNTSIKEGDRIAFSLMLSDVLSFKKSEE